MWVFLTARLRQWVLLSVALPLLARAARSLGERLERRRGSSRLSRTLHRVASLGRRGRGRRRAGRG